MSIARAAWPAIRENLERRDGLGRGCDRHNRGRPALREERLEQLGATLDAEGQRLAKEPLHVRIPERLCAPEDDTRGVGEVHVLDVDRARRQQLAPLVGHADHRGVDVEHVDDRLRERIERLVERQLLRERARDLVQRPEPACCLALGRERGLPLAAELGRLLVELRVLDGHCELPRECLEQRRLVVRRPPAERGIGGEHADHFGAHDEGHRDRSLDPGLARRIAHRP